MTLKSDSERLPWTTSSSGAAGYFLRRLSARSLRIADRGRVPAARDGVYQDLRACPLERLERLERSSSSAFFSSALRFLVAAHEQIGHVSRSW